MLLLLFSMKLSHVLKTMREIEALSLLSNVQRNYQRAGWFSNRSLHFSEYDYMLSYASPMFLTTHSRKQKRENLAY